ncbi:DUF1330 domain-containing protein [Nocardioides sp. NPDC057767]|uniref:DUF1330 domain-containing protein n=1 Tax=unclassified Nocardioides TaxID=2615069 RepID=UPI00366AFCA2
MTTKPAYAVAWINGLNVNDDIVEYLRRVDATLAPFDGEFLIHGPDLVVAEGTAEGMLVVLRFPSTEAAQGWYASPAYQEILPLRLNNIDRARSFAILAEGVAPGYSASQKIAEFMS